MDWLAGLKITQLVLKIIFIFYPKVINLILRRENKLTEEVINDPIKVQLKQVLCFIKSYKIESEVINRPNEVKIVNDIKDKLKFKNSVYYFSNEEISLKILDLLTPKFDKKFNRFLKFSYCFEFGYKKYQKFELFKSRILSRLWFKNTPLHYMSINNYRDKTFEELINEVDSITKVSPDFSVKYILPDENNIKKKMPVFSRTISKIIRDGFIREETIFNLSSNQKIVLVQKYAEGFGPIYDIQQTEIRKLKSILNADRISQRKLAQAEKRLKQIEDNYVATPISTILTEYGFHKLFKNMDGVFFLPHSMVPDLYKKDIGLFMNNEIIKSAREYLTYLKQNKEIIEEVRIEIDKIPESLNYILMFEVFKVNEINLLKSNRNLSFASPFFSRVMFSNFMREDETRLTSFYINDMIKNVDFRSQVNASSAAGNFIIEKYEKLKKHLWVKYKIDISKPIDLIKLRSDDLDKISTHLLGSSKKTTKGQLKRMLSQKIKHYETINRELELIRMSKNELSINQD